MGISSVTAGRTAWFVGLAVTIAGIGLVPGCSPKPAPDIDKAKAVVLELFEAEINHRNANGNFWRDRQPIVRRAASMKMIGVDVGKADGFDIIIEPAVDGMDTMLEVIARPKDDAAGPTLTCTQRATEPKPTCTQIGGAA